MSEQEHVIRTVQEAINRGRMGALDRVVSNDVVDHSALPFQAPGLEGFKQRLITLCHAYPGLVMSVDEVRVEGEKVEWSWHAEYPGGPGPSSRLEGRSVERIVDGKIVEHWSRAEVGLELQPAHSGQYSLDSGV